MTFCIKRIKEEIKPFYNILKDIAKRDNLNHRFYIKRIKEEIRKSWKLAKIRFPNKKIYFLSNINFNLNFCKQIRNLKEINGLIKNSVFICYYDNDEDYINQLEKIKRRGGNFVSLLITSPVAKYIHKNNNASKAMKNILKDAKEFSLPNIDKEDFQNIMQALEITKNIKGDYVEIGVFMGASGIAALNYMKEANITRNCYFIDTYDGFTYEEAKKSFDAVFEDTHILFGVKKTMDFIKKIFKKFDVPHFIIKANICKDYLPHEIKKIAVCNIDVDMYDAVLSSLDKVAPLISQYGIIITEDFGHTPALGGAHLAVKEFLESKIGKSFLPIYMESGQMFLIKK